MPNLARRARRRRRAILADQLAASLATARIGWSRTDRGVDRRAPLVPAPDARPGDGLVVADGPSAPVPVRVQAHAAVRPVPQAWLITCAAVGQARAQRIAAARRVSALSCPRPGWPGTLEEIAAAVGLTFEGWSGRRCRLADPVLGSILVTISPHRDGWEHQVFERGRGGRNEESEITDEVPHLWFGDLFERVDGLGDAASWASMARTLRLQEGDWQVTVELDVVLDDRVSDLELASAIARAVVGGALPAIAPIDAKRRRPWRRR